MSQKSADTTISLQTISNKVNVIKDFPKQGIYFRNISPLLADHDLFSTATKLMAAIIIDSGITFDYIAGMESRGFLFIALAQKLGKGFVMLRKPGKLPNVETFTYEKEYGTDSLTIEKGVIEEGSSVLVVDDLIATGGTVYAADELLKKIGCKAVAAMTLIELTGLKMNSKLVDSSLPIFSLLKYPYNSESKQIN